MRAALRALRWLLAAGTAALAAGVLAFAAAYVYIAPRLPDIEALREVRLQVPLRVLARDGSLIAEFGEKRRVPLELDRIPPRLVQAFLAAEDDRFYEHPGVDWQGLLRAAVALVRTGEKRQGGSTITMQVARNFFLSREKTFARKLAEIFLALKIERELDKDRILELYLNKIYLGQRAYGVGAAARVYYGKDVERLTLPEMAMIAGLPKAPSRDNPVASPERARARRNYVLGRMLALGMISRAEYEDAVAAPVTARLHAARSEVEAPYAAEMVRAQLVERYGEAVYTDGYVAVTTIEPPLQRAALAAVRANLLAYSRRHGWRGPEGRVELPPGLAEAAPGEGPWKALDRALAERRPLGGLAPAVVVEVGERTARAYLGAGKVVEVPWEGLAWARPYIDTDRRGPAPKRAADVLAPGDLVRLERRADGSWWLAQLPRVEGALVALAPADGAVRALVGGFDFERSKFNRAVQAQRQPGSSFKPFIYAAALEKGFTAASLINDAPVVFDDPALEATWRPENYSGRFHGPTRLREALVHSRNLVSIRLLRAIGVGYAVRYAARFGFEPAHLPRDLSLALGSGSVTPLAMARAYAVFANSGYRVEPYLLLEVRGPDGEVLERARPLRACPECEAAQEAAAADPARAGDGEAGTGRAWRPAPRVIPERIAWLMRSMMRDVVRRGTGRAARVLGRPDIGGKTGTTNDQRDAWFCGFGPGVVAVTWTGFDRLAPLGERETGARAALPAWIRFMRVALAGVPVEQRPLPEGLVTVRIDPATGLLAAPGQADAVFETFRAEHVPQATAAATPAGGGAAPEPIF